MRRRILSSPMLLALLLPTESKALDLAQQPFVVRTWQQPDGVASVSQGPDGMLWFGLLTGLTRFDGERFTVVNLEQGGGAAGPWVRQVLATRDGAVWAATGAGALEVRGLGQPALFPRRGPDGGLVRLLPHLPVSDPARLRRFSTADGLPGGWVWALAEDRAGAVWIGADGGLARFAEGRFQRFSTGDGLPGSLVTSLAVGGDGTLYVGTGSGVVVRRGGRFVATAIRESVVALAADRAGRLWAAGLDRVWRLDPDGGLQSFAAERPTAIAVDLDDNVWVANLLRVFARGRPVPLARPIAANDLILGLMVDREGSLWVTVREGQIRQVSAPRVRNLGQEEGIPGLAAFSVFQARDGSMLVSGDDGVSRHAQGVWTPWLRGGEPISLAEGPASGSSAGLWLGSEFELRRMGARGLRTVRRLPMPERFKEGGYHSVVPTRAGELWVAQWRVGLLRFPDGDVTRPPIQLQPRDGLCSAMLAHGFEASDGSLWFASVEGAGNPGVTRVVDGRPRCHGAADGLPQAEIRAVTEDGEGNVWLGTGWGAGLVRHRQGRFATIPVSAGLPHTTITGLLDDGRGHLWIGSESGVWQVPKADLHRCADGPCSGVRATVFNQDRGMRTAECTGAFHPNMALDRRGNVWVATLQGVTVFAPQERAPPVLTPIVEEISLDGIPVKVGSTLHIGPRQRDLVVRYTVASFVGERRPRLRHRLQGFDGGWLAASSPAVAHYHDLAEGHYTLELGAGDEGSAVARLAIVVEPPLWRTRRFAALMVVTMGAVLFGLHRVRLARLEARHRTMIEERRRIARDVHDGLTQKLRAIGLLADRVRLAPGDLRAPGELVEMRQIVGEAHAELRRTIWDLRQGAADQQRLEKLIERLLSEVQVPSEIKVTLETSPSSLPVDAELAYEAQQVAKEALTNAIRHAQATTIQVGVLSDEEGMHLWVRDNGRGLDWDGKAAAGRSSGYGLLGMHERARRLGGVLTTNSQPGRGTEVSLFVPGRDQGERLMIGVLVVEDNFFTRTGTVAFLRGQPDIDVVGEASDGGRALALFQERRPDVTVVDLCLPDMDGVELTTALCAQVVDARILVLTQYQGDEDIFQALKAGARGYLTKESSGEDLLGAIRALHAGEQFLPPEIAERIASRRGQQQLTRRERQVLGEVAEGATNRDVAQTLGISAGTVALYVNSILSKFGACSRTEAVAIARRRGLLAREP